MPNLHELKFQVVCHELSWDQLPEAATNMITGLAEFLATFPTEHKLQRIDIFFNCEIDLTKFEKSQRPRSVKAHLRTGNWAALDSMIVRIANAAEHLLELHIKMGYFIGFDQNTDFEEAQHPGPVMKDWGVTYLPCLSKSPKVVMAVRMLYHDYYHR